MSTIFLKSSFIKSDGQKLKKNKPKKEKKSVVDIAEINAISFVHLTKKQDYQVFTISIRDIKQHLEKQNRSVTDSGEIVPLEYHKFLDIFSKKVSDILLSRRPYDHKLELIEDPEKTLQDSPLYQISTAEFAIVKKYLKENLQKRFIIVNSASIVFPVLFVKKPEEELRFYVDYHKLNSIIQKNQYPISLLEETLTQLIKSRYFTKLDIRQAFHGIRIHEEDEWLITFKIGFGLYQYMVLSFGLTEESAIFQQLINNVLWDFLYKFAIAYIDNILIYNENLSDHHRHVRTVLQALRDAGLQVDIDKYEFYIQETKFLGLIIDVHDIKMNPAKIAVITE